MNDEFMEAFKNALLMGIREGLSIGTYELIKYTIRNIVKRERERHTSELFILERMNYF